MNAPLRRRHALTWLFLGPAILAMMLLLLAFRPPTALGPAADATESRP